MSTEQAAIKARHARLFSACFVLVVLLDQFTKELIRGSLAVGEHASFIPGLIDLLHVQNTGAAFSLGEGAGWIFIVIAVVITVFAVALIMRDATLSNFFVCCLGLVCGGGIGNVLDRVRFGAVTDFLATTFISFPVFNVADIFVTCGIAALLIYSLFFEQDE